GEVADEDREHGGSEHAHEEGEPERRGDIANGQGRRVGAHAEESRVAERHEPAVPEGEVEGRPEERVDEDPREEVQVVGGVQAPHPERRGPEDERHERARHAPVWIEGEPSQGTGHRWAVPKRPLGRMTRTTAMTRNTSGVWNAGSNATPKLWT